MYWYVIGTAAKTPVEGSEVEVIHSVHRDVNGQRSGSPNPDQTNMYKADGGIWLILSGWMDVPNSGSMTTV